MKIKGGPKQALLGATIGFFVGFAAVALFGPTVHKFKELMNLSPVMVGLLVAVPALTGSLLRIPFSCWADVEGGRKPFLILLSLAILGMIGLTLVSFVLYPSRLSASHYPLLLLLGLFCGCGIATFSVGITQVSYWYPQRLQGSALGSYAGWGNLAPGVFTLLLPLSLANLGLAFSYLIWLSLLVIGTILYYYLGSSAWYFQLRASKLAYDEARQKAKELGQEIIPSGSLSSALLISARMWKTWLLVFIYFTSFGGFIALTAWLPTYWKSYFAFSAVLAGVLTAVYSIMTSLTRVAGGKLADKVGGSLTLRLALLITLMGSILVTLSSAFLISLIAIIILALGMGIANAAVFKLVPQEIPKAVGGAAGWVGGLGALGGFVIPPLLGAFVRSFGEPGYSLGFIVFVLLAVISLVFSFLFAPLPKLIAPIVAREKSAP